MTSLAKREAMEIDMDDTSTDSGLFLIGGERLGALVLDQQNVAGQFDRLGFRKIDPRWYLAMASRITNIRDAVVVTDLQVINPCTNQQYLNTAWIWDKYNFATVHVPARRIAISSEGDDIKGEQELSDEQERALFVRKNMTDEGVRNQIRLFSMLPDVGHILIGSHDSDFAADAQNTSWAKGKKVTLLTVGKENIATKLRAAVSDVVDILGYTSGYSAHALSKRGFWRITETKEDLRKKVGQWFHGDAAYTRYLENQLSDMQRMFQHMIHDLRLVPPQSSLDAQKLSMGRLKIALHDFMSWEKKLAKLEFPVVPNPDAHPRSIEAQDLHMIPAQARACDQSLERLIRTLIENEVIQFEREGTYLTKLFYLNTDHPAVQLILELPPL
ncbi:MAG: hypothetical protein P1P90_02520 [Patescibacteria group bacterium]|nr:hypothetical protein [Patescibacteria group bacterium]